MPVRALFDSDGSYYQRLYPGFLVSMPVRALFDSDAGHAVGSPISTLVSMPVRALFDSDGTEVSTCASWRTRFNAREGFI